MIREKYDRWLSLGGNLGILVGLLLVALELNQATVTARAEMASSFQDRWVDIDISWQDPAFSETWAKSLTQPTELTTSEMFQLNGFMWTFGDHLANYRLLWDLGIFEPPQESYEEVVRDVADIYFGSDFGRAWYEENKSSLFPVVVEILDEEIKRFQPNEYLAQFERIKKRLEKN